MPLEWPSDVPGPRPRKQRKAKGSSGRGSKGTTVGMAIVFGLPALVFFGALGYCLYFKVAA